MSNSTSSDRAIAELGRRYGSGLLDEAVEQARTRVRAELARRLESAMLAAALSEVDVTSSTSEPAVADETGLYVYGFTRAADLDLAGEPGVCADEPVRVIARDDVGLIVSRVRLAEFADLAESEPTEHSRVAEFARRHDAVVRAAFDQDAVLPLRFGTVLPDEAVAASLLDERHDDARRLLDRVAGKREWGAKVYRTPDRTEPAELTEPAEEPSTGTEYLTRKRSELAARRAAADRRREVVDAVHAELAGSAADSTRRAAGTDDVLLDGAYLVAEQDTERFLAEIEEISGRLSTDGLALRASGPWPPYSFAAMPERVGG